MGERSSSPYEVATRAIKIYEQSIAEAAGAMPEYIEHGDGSLSLAVGTRGEAAAEYAREMGIAFTDVRVTRHYGRVDLAAIVGEAVDVALELEPGDDLRIAYTWEGEGWLYEECSQLASRSIAFWRCERRTAKVPS